MAVDDDGCSRQKSEAAHRMVADPLTRQRMVRRRQKLRRKVATASTTIVAVVLCGVLLSLAGAKAFWCPIPIVHAFIIRVPIHPTLGRLSYSTTTNPRKPSTTILRQESIRDSSGTFSNSETGNQTISLAAINDVSELGTSQKTEQQLLDDAVSTGTPSPSFTDSDNNEVLIPPCIPIAATEPAVPPTSHAATTPKTTVAAAEPLHDDDYVNAMGSPLVLREVDVLYGRSHALFYDPLQERFVKQSERKSNRNNNNQQQQSQNDSLKTAGNTSNSTPSNKGPTQWLGRCIAFPTLFIKHRILPPLAVAFLPAGVTPNYYRFMRWRVLQRFVSANLHVFGTQSLLMGLGIKSSASQLGALSAALKWVLKDALGKFVRMAWAAQMGRRFDSDAKRWRFRSAFIFAAGNFLEIVTYVWPRMFLVWATLANCCKQMSMLTSSSTRTALYNSFRDGSRENIGDITAKGEAQIAIVDLLGIASGVSLSRVVGTSIRNVMAVYVLLQSWEIVCMYKELRSVVYRVLNFERMAHVIQRFVKHTSTFPAAIRSASIRRDDGGCGIPTPAVMAQQERIFLPPRHLCRRSTAFGSLGRARLSPQELASLMEIFRRERFLLVVGSNEKQRTRQPHPNRYARIRKLLIMKDGNRTINQSSLNLEELQQEVQGNCHIVLHSAATNVDIVKSTLALTLLRQKLADAVLVPQSIPSEVLPIVPKTVRSIDCLSLISEAQHEADELFPLLLRHLSKQGWESPARFMFGRVHMRAEWPILNPSGQGGGGSAGG